MLDLLGWNGPRINEFGNGLKLKAKFSVEWHRFIRLICCFGLAWNAGLQLLATAEAVQLLLALNNQQATADVTQIPLMLANFKASFPLMLADYKVPVQLMQADSKAIISIGLTQADL